MANEKKIAKYERNFVGTNGGTILQRLRQGHIYTFGSDISEQDDLEQRRIRENIEQINTPSQGEIIAPSEGVSYASSGSGLPQIGFDPNISLINAIDRLDNHSLYDMEVIADRDVLFVRIMEVFLITLGVLGIIGNIIVFCGLRNDKKSTSTTFLLKKTRHD